MKENFQALSSEEARLFGAILGLGFVIAINTGVLPQVLNKLDKFIEEQNISTNLNDYSVKTTIQDDIVCYTKDYPKLSNGLQITTFNDAYCPGGLNGQTKFVTLSIPTVNIIKYPKSK